MCLLCGDPYSVENVLGPLLRHQNCYLSGDRSVALETQLGGDCKRKVEVKWPKILVLFGTHMQDERKYHFAKVEVCIFRITENTGIILMAG